MDVLKILEDIGFRLSLIDSELLRVKEMLSDVCESYKNQEYELWSQESYHDAT